ncbi:hypothetical protein FDECE_3862 [Fusarium decemcellulare]|nr:hypothetical protein FDECE_3862 [Fusarium decemcellulare]
MIGMWAQYLLLGFAYLLQPASADATQTIASMDNYKSQRSCATECFWNGDPSNPDAQDVIGIRLQCCPQFDCDDHVKDSCYCRADLRTSAVAWLSTCVEYRCRNSVDASSAISIYDEYCGRDLPTNTDATTTEETGQRETGGGNDPGNPGAQATAATTQDESSGGVSLHPSIGYMMLGCSFLVFALNVAA